MIRSFGQASRKARIAMFGALGAALLAAAVVAGGALAAPEEVEPPRRKTVRLGLGGDIALTSPSVWALRVSGRDSIAALASDIELAAAAALPRTRLRDLSPPQGATADLERLAAVADMDRAARDDLAAGAAPDFDADLGRLLQASFLEGRNRLKGDRKAAERETRCLAEAIYFEARGEPLEGQAAVAEVVLNRVESLYWPGTVCGVVNQGASRRTGCQFSYTCDGKPDRVSQGSSAWRQAQRLARFMMSGGPRRITGRATHYHADYVDPPWAKTMERTAVVGRHIFYRRLLRFTIE